MPLQETVCTDANQLLNLLEPRATSPLTGAKRWVYRGQGDADWDLLPTAFRRDELFPSMFGLMTVTHWRSAIDPLVSVFRSKGVDLPENLLLEVAQIGLEAHVLASFFETADTAGLALPDDTPVLRERLAALGGLSRLTDFRDPHAKVAALLGDWPPLELRSILALARHHGLPTRLLDWSHDCRIAAFFAAKCALKHGTQRLAVWALDWEQVKVQTALSPALSAGTSSPCRLSLVTAPAASNVRLRAQRGLFTLLTPAPYLGTDQSALANLLSEARKPLNHVAEVTLRKFLLPCPEASSLLKLLALDGVTAATVLADYGGVVESLFDASSRMGAAHAADHPTPTDER